MDPLLDDEGFSIYASPKGAYVVVEDCMTPALEAERLYGPLTLCDRIRPGDFRIPGLWNAVGSQIDDQLFAVLEESVGRQLLRVERGAAAA
jgi:hypothetical protein